MDRKVVVIFGVVAGLLHPQLQDIVRCSELQCNCSCSCSGSVGVIVVVCVAVVVVEV